MDFIALEEIRRTKHRYLRCVDLKRWDDFADTLTEDAAMDYGTRVFGDRLRLTGRDAVVEYMRTHLTSRITTAHHASQPEIDVDGDHAAGTWYFEDTIIAMDYRTMIRGAAYYEDTYVRCDDAKWRISTTRYDRIYEFTMSLDDLPSLKMLSTPLQ
jgi:hypothetical protein